MGWEWRGGGVEITGLDKIRGNQKVRDGIWIYRVFSDSVG